MRNYAAKILFFLVLLSPFMGIAQYKYSIDIAAPKKNRVPIKEQYQIAKQELEESREKAQIRKENAKVSKMTINHTYSIQTRKVRQRMKQSRCRAAQYNGYKSFWCLTLHKFKRHG